MLTVMSVNLRYGASGDRWPGLAELAAHTAKAGSASSADINHQPPGDREPPWDDVPAHDRSARTVASDPGLRANHIVGQILARGDLIDVAAYLADQRDDPSLRAWTGQIGKVRTDQMHITKDLLPALVDYQRIDAKPGSDHDAVVAVLDPAKTPATPDTA